MRRIYVLFNRLKAACWAGASYFMIRTSATSVVSGGVLQVKLGMLSWSWYCRSCSVAGITRGDVLCVHVGFLFFFTAVRDYETAQQTSDNDKQIREGLEKAQRLLKQSQKRDYYKILGVKRYVL